MLEAGLVVVQGDKYQATEEGKKPSSYFSPERTGLKV